MEVTVDGKRDFVPAGSKDSILSVLGEISDRLRRENRAIMGVRIDGRDLSPASLSDEVTGLCIEDVQLLEVMSDDLKGMVLSALRDLEENLPELPLACSNLAAVFHGEHPEEGYEPFQNLAEIWTFVKKQQLLVSNAIGLSMDDLALEGVSLERMHEDLNGVLEEAAQALKDNDCVLLGDLLEYELAPRAEKETDIVTLMRAQVPGDFGSS